VENNNTILHDLKSYAIAPPAFLFDNITNKIEEDNHNITRTFKSLIQHSVAPPVAAISFGSIMNRIKETDQLNTFKPLKDYEVAPPFSFAKLMEIIRALVIVPSLKPTAKVISFSNTFKRIAAAAAVLLLCFVGYFTYKNSKINPQEDSASIASVTPSTTQPSTIAPIGDSANTSTTNNASIASILNTNRFNTKKQFGSGAEYKRKMFFGASPTPVEVPAPTELLINGSKFTIVDNDYLATFASFNETNLPAFLQVDNPVATQITIDDYASITITEGMGAMMKKMYKTKKSGKPTRRARKQREKLEKWKKADADFFNPNINLNPLDPIDLGNFILYK
jgi:hypothetical protein